MLRPAVECFCPTLSVSLFRTDFWFEMQHLVLNKDRIIFENEDQLSNVAIHIFGNERWSLNVKESLMTDG